MTPIKTYTTQWSGKTLTIEIGKLARQATGSCTVRLGDTMVLVTAVMAREQREGQGFFPLSVEFEERLYAAGKIKGSRFIKREGRASDEAILSARLIDRSIRPLFPSWLMNDVQVVVTVLSLDQAFNPDVLGLIGASVVLSYSSIPWEGPIGALRVGRIGGEWVLNPGYEALEKSDMDVVVAGTPDKVVMVEAGANCVADDDMVEAIFFAQKHIAPVIDLVETITRELGTEKTAPPVVSNDDDLESETADMVRAYIIEKIGAYIFGKPHDSKDARARAVGAIMHELDEMLKEKQVGKEKRKRACDMVFPLVEAEVSRAIIEEGKRVDGRSVTQVRPLHVEVGAIPRVHGSGLFERGDTQVLTVLTLGAPSDEQILDGMDTDGKKRYMHHYNFPPYSVGEAGRIGGPGRREIGHGALAERALMSMIPDKESFPYTIRLVSEVLGSNGSSSMGSTCGSSLALMDAGVPIREHVAGVAMGIATDEAGRYRIITDLQDLEDGKGGMDFKIAGTKSGVTAVQMDTKTKGLSRDIVRETFAQAREARLHILDAMNTVLPASRTELSPFAPRITTLRINPEKIRDVIGPGGKVINEIIDSTGVKIDIEQDGLVLITALTADAAQKAQDWIIGLTREVAPGEVFEGKVTRLFDFGAMVEVLPGQEGLVHISELAHRRVAAVKDEVNIGDTVKVKVLSIDGMGRINLSRKALLPRPEGSSR